MSSLAGVAAALAAPPVENWGQLSWIDDQHKGQSDVKQLKEEEDEGKKTVLQPVLKLLSLPKKQQQNSGAPANAAQKPIIQIPVSAISSVTATTKNDLSILLQPQASVTAVPGANVSLELTSVRFAIPNVCVGHERTEEAGREVLAEAQERLREHQRRVLGGNGAMGAGPGDQALMAMGGGRREDECVIAVFDDLTLSFPSGRFKLIVTNYTLLLEERKRAGGDGGIVTMVPLTDVVQLYLCDIPTSRNTSNKSVDAEDDTDFPQYVVVILRNPVKVRATTYSHIVITCPVGFILDEQHAWSCELKTQEEIDRVLSSLPHKQSAAKDATQQQAAKGDTFPPTITGRVSELLIRVLKTIAGVKALGGHNKDYQTRNGNSVLRCLYQSNEGLLYVLQSALLFLHRPATRISYGDIQRIEVDESERGSTTFQMTVYGNLGKRARGGADKVTIASLPITEKEALLTYLQSKVEVVRTGAALEDSDGDDDDDSGDGEDDESSDEEDSFDDDDDDDDEDEDDDDDDGANRKKRKRSSSKGDESGKRRDKEHKHGRHKKHKKDH